MILWVGGEETGQKTSNKKMPSLKKWCTAAWEYFCSITDRPQSSVPIIRGTCCPGAGQKKSKPLCSQAWGVTEMWAKYVDNKQAHFSIYYAALMKSDRAYCNANLEEDSHKNKVQNKCSLQTDAWLHGNGWIVRRVLFVKNSIPFSPCRPALWRQEMNDLRPFVIITSSPIKRRQTATAAAFIF